jgi:Tfp pilus assembly protein PilX
MKTKLPDSTAPSRSERGYAVVVVLGLLSIMVLLVAANTHTLNLLRNEIRLVEKRQTERLASAAKGPPTGHGKVEPGTSP